MTKFKPGDKIKHQPSGSVATVLVVHEGGQEFDIRWDGTGTLDMVGAKADFELATRVMATPLYVRITEGSEDQENVSIVVTENETFSFGALGWSGGLPHIDLYRANGERVRFDLEYFKKVAVAVDHIDFQPQRKPLPLENPVVRAAYLRAGKSEAERILEVLAERDAFKLKLMESLVYMSLLADNVEVLRGGKPDGYWRDGKRLAEEIRQFVRDGHKL